MNPPRIDNCVEKIAGDQPPGMTSTVAAEFVLTSSRRSMESQDDRIRGRIVGVLSALPGAVDRDEFHVVYQPQVDVGSGRVVAVEALARWTHPESGPVSPVDFIPYAEANGMLAEISDFVLAEAGRCAASWKALGLRVAVAVNVSASQLDGSAFLDSLARTIAAWSLRYEDVIVEVTETAPFAGGTAVAGRLGELCEAGLTVSIDDFGTGFSSEERLDELPVTEIKIDRSLVWALPVVTSELAAITTFAGVHHLRLVAEGVETAEQLAAVTALGCDRAQGYYISHPLAEAEATRFLQHA
jgi:EAL domain-containing protein (putative c-di-GMP-specific phosphodiesterase class I)